MQMPKKLGAFTTMITPYREDGTIDYETAAAYTRWYCEKGLSGIFAVCQSSEIFYLTVEERVRLNSVVYQQVQQWNRTHHAHVTVVSSGHVADSIPEQAAELSAIWQSGTDALILITNRLDPTGEGDDYWIHNAETLLSLLPAQAKLGLYECPYPYKRLVTPRILEWCLSTGRFYFLKDTCCDAALLQSRLQQLSGTEFHLLNANCQTLLQSLTCGAAGYCGIMCNFHPELYQWLCQNYDTQPEKAQHVQNLLGSLGFTESGLPYPLTAKYHMCLEGIPTVNYARAKSASMLTDYVKDCVKQMRDLTDWFTQTVLRQPE